MFMVKSVNFRHWVNLQTVESQMKQLLVSHLNRIITVCLDMYLFYSSY